MAGHSKWANTKHRKAAQDSKREKIFTKIIRELVTASRLGGSDPGSNPRLRAVIDKALSNNMARDTLHRAILRGASGNDENNMETSIYEGYGPGGTAVIVNCLSDNRNRTVSDMRYVFTKFGGNLSTEGSVSYLFIKKGVISYTSCLNEDKLIYAAMEAGADDVVSYENGTMDVFTPWETFDQVKNTLDEVGLQAKSAVVTMIPSINANIDTETAKQLICLINMLKSFDDVQEVYHNGKLPEKMTWL